MGCNGDGFWLWDSKEMHESLALFCLCLLNMTVPTCRFSFNARKDIGKQPKRDSFIFEGFSVIFLRTVLRACSAVDKSRSDMWRASECKYARLTMVYFVVSLCAHCYPRFLSPFGSDAFI